MVFFMKEENNGLRFNSLQQLATESLRSAEVLNTKLLLCDLLFVFFVFQTDKIFSCTNILVDSEKWKMVRRSKQLAHKIIWRHP